MRYITFFLVAMLATNPAVADNKPKKAVTEAIDPDCNAGKAVKGTAMKATVGVGNRCGVAETARDTAGVDGKAKDVKKKVSN
jgi:hypothetical protein